MPFNIYCIVQLYENVTIFDLQLVSWSLTSLFSTNMAISETISFTVYVASLHVVNQQKVCLLSEVFKPSMVVMILWLNAVE